MRELYIKNGQGFILVYSINSENSIKELVELRQQILRIKGGNSNIPMVLVGNKADLQTEKQVSSDYAIELANSWGKTPFYETSAKYRSNVEEVFKDLVRQMMRRDSAYSHSVHSSIDGDLHSVPSPTSTSTKNSTKHKKNSSSTSIFHYRFKSNSQQSGQHQQSLSQSNIQTQHLQAPGNLQTSPHSADQPSYAFLNRDPNEQPPLSPRSPQLKTATSLNNFKTLRKPKSSKSLPTLKQQQLHKRNSSKDCIIC